MQAKTLNEQELMHVVSAASQGRWGTRNRALLLITHYTGMRVCEVASLRIHHVLNVQGVRNWEATCVSSLDSSRSPASHTSSDRNRCSTPARTTRSSRTC